MLKLIMLQKLKRFHPTTNFTVFHFSTLSLQERLRSDLPTESDNVSIFKVPANLRQVEPKAYKPNIVSIGPYHHGKSRLQAMEKVKWQYFHRLFKPVSHGSQQKLEAVIEAMKRLEPVARSYYSEDVENLIKIDKEKFVEMMIVDGCFILELFKDLEKSKGNSEVDINHGHGFLKRWMLPILRNDLIKLENQLPLPVLCKLFEFTNCSLATPSYSSIRRLALNFFSPLMLGADKTPPQKSNPNNMGNEEANHLLDLFRSSILPQEIKHEREPYLFRSMVELKEAGIKIRAGSGNQKALDIKFESGILKIPPFRINDYQCTLYRNIVAFEQCYKACQPDVTRYLFFLDGLINSAKDIELLHYAGVLQHCLGSNKHVARTVNKLCREVSRDTNGSYLGDVVRSMEEYCNEPWHRYRASLVHNYFTNLWVTVSTAAAAILVYLAVLQTCCDLAETHDSLHESGFWKLVAKSFIIPFSHSLTVTDIVSLFDEFHKFLWLHF